jgi:FAD/FMN-containing dehydrogenase
MSTATQHGHGPLPPAAGRVDSVRPLLGNSTNENGDVMTGAIEGPVAWRGDEHYEATRRRMVWNALKPDRYPEAIVSAASDADVVAAIELARSRGLQVAVRAGGHSWIGSPLRDGALLIDLSSLREVAIDEAARSAAVRPAVTSTELAQALEARGLAFPVGHCPSVGISGFLLSGGLGWNTGAWGPACLSLQAIDVVTPEGELLRADADQNAELLWAARGAGPGFPGVVTRFHIALQPLPQAITTSTYVYGLSELDAVAEWASGITNSLPPTVELTLLVAPASRDVDAGPEGRVLIVTATAFEDSKEEAAAALSALERSPVVDRALVRKVHEPSPFEVLFRDFGGLWREGRRCASDNVWANADFTDILPRLRAHLAEAPSPESLAFAVVGPEQAEDAPAPGLPDMAFSMVGRSFVACYAMWENEADDAANQRWLPSVMAGLEPLAIGHYVAETDLTAAGSRPERCFATRNWERLRTLRRDVDPLGVFPSYLAPA